MKDVIPVLVLVILTSTLSLSAAGPAVDGAVNVKTPNDSGEPPPGYQCPTPNELNLVDRTCSANDACGGSEPWPVRTSGTSTGEVGGGYDTEDWSRVEMYRTEALVPSAASGFVVEQGGLSCTPSVIPSLYAEQNGWYALRVSATAHAPYTLHYDIIADDATSGKDAGNTAADAWFINALPKSLNPTHGPVVYTGSIPNRDDQPLGPDQDWYRIGSTLAAASDPTQTQGPAVGLLTVEFTVDCNGGTYRFGFYEADGLTPIGNSMNGCGIMPKSCITTGAAPVHAQMAVTDRTGTGYDFTAELVPLHLVDLSDGVPRPYLFPREPWCDSLVNEVLEAASGQQSGTDVGLVTPDGLVVAQFKAE